MQANNRDLAALWDMAQSIREFQEFTAELSYESYLENRLAQRAVERSFQILGEATRRLSDDFRTTPVEIDWQRIIGLRNVLAHQYDVVRQDVLWDIITALLPNLLSQIEVLMPAGTDRDN